MDDNEKKVDDNVEENTGTVGETTEETQDDEKED